MKLEVGERTLRLGEPFHASYGEVRERELLVVTLTDDDGVQGYGEAAPLDAYDGVGLERVREALERYAEVLAEAAPGTALEEVLYRCGVVDAWPQALSALDIAGWDLRGRRAGRPVAELLCERPADSVSVNATVAALDRAGAAAQAARAARAGFGAVKLKVGVGDDAGRVAAVRAAVGPSVALRLDANGAWSVPEAVAAIESLAPAGLELVEEPTHGVEHNREVRERVSQRIAIDETSLEPGALTAGGADAVCLKVARLGGITGVMEAAAQVRGSGAEVYVSSTLEGPLGIAAGVHAAAALAGTGPLAYCGLATLGLFEGLADVLPVRDGAIALPRGPGLGVAPF